MVKRSGVMRFIVKLPGQRLPPTGRSVVLQVRASLRQVEDAHRGVTFEQIHVSTQSKKKNTKHFGVKSDEEQYHHNSATEQRCVSRHFLNCTPLLIQ